MKVVVVGSLPPPVTERARNLLAEVLRLRREGAEVEVISPRPDTVAHRYLGATGGLAALELVYAIRRTDSVVVQIEPGFPVDERSGRMARAVGLGTLALALRWTRGEVVLRLYSMHDLPRGAGGRAADLLWATAHRIEVGTEETLSRLESSLGSAERAKLSLSTGTVALGGARDGSAAVEANASLEAVTRLVRARAAADRSRLLADPVDAAGQVRAQARVALWEWQPAPGAGIPEFAAMSGTAAGVRESRARRAARALLVAAEARPVSRPLARLARAGRRLLARSSR